MSFASLADPEEVRRALLTALATLKCKAIHTAAFLEAGVCESCTSWANGGAAKTVARWLFLAAGARGHFDKGGRWQVQASASQYRQVGIWLEQLEQLSRGEDPENRSAA